jgi:hypothetical protein
MGGGQLEDVERGQSATAANAVDFLPGVALHGFVWRALGAVLASDAPFARGLAGRARFTVRPGASFAPPSGAAAAAAAAGAEDDGDDPSALSSANASSSTRHQLLRSTIAEGAGDLAATVRLGHFLVSVAACNLSARSGGADAPLAALRASARAGLRASLAAAVADDTYAALSYDAATGRPELSLCWTGETPTERASLSLHADPVDRALRVRAAVSAPGPEWRGDVLDERTGLVALVPDDGGRHAAWVEHEARPGSGLLATRAGARLDVGRAANWLAALVDDRVRQRLPKALWRVPGAGAVYNFLVPPEDEDQFRYRVRGWEVDVACSDASRPRRSTRVALTRRLRLHPKRALLLTEDEEGGGGGAGEEAAVLREAERTLAAIAADRDAGRRPPEGQDDDRDEMEAMLAVAEHRAARARRSPAWRARQGEEASREEAAEADEAAAAAARGGGGGGGGGGGNDKARRAAARAAHRRLVAAGHELEPLDVDPERYGFDKRTRHPGVSAAVGAAYDLGSGALGAELRLGSALRAVAGVGTLTRSGGLSVAPSLTLAIEPLALF